MRITKKMLRDAKRGMQKRTVELCAMMVTGGLADEVKRCFPLYLSQPVPRDADCMRMLLADLFDLAIPPHWHD